MAARNAARAALTKYGKQVAALDWTPQGGQLASYADLVTDVTVRTEMVTQEGHALLDEAEYPIAARERTEIQFSMLVEDTCPFVEITDAASRYGALVLTPFAGTGVKSYRGTFLVTNVEHSMPDGPQSIRVTLQSMGTVAFSASA